jgi:1-acyl-sn-glycerol-3-phosphate acyltransferase
MEPDKAQAKSVLSLAAVIWLNLYFWTFFALWTLILAFIAIPYQYLYYKLTGNQRRAGWLIRRTISHYGNVVIRSGWPLVNVQYVDTAPEEKPPFVFVANHRSTADAFLMAFLDFECVQVLNVWTSRLPLVNYLSRTGGYLRVREIPFEKFMEQGKKLLADGVSVIVFPEGTRSGSRTMGPFHGAAFRLAQSVGVKVCPVAVSGSEEIPGRGSLIMHPGRIVVTKLRSITSEEYAGLNAFSLKMRAREIIQRQLDSQELQSHHLSAQPAC